MHFKKELDMNSKLDDGAENVFSLVGDPTGEVGRLEAQRNVLSAQAPCSPAGDVSHEVHSAVRRSRSILLIDDPQRADLSRR